MLTMTTLTPPPPAKRQRVHARAKQRVFNNTQLMAVVNSFLHQPSTRAVCKQWLYHPHPSARIVLNDESSSRLFHAIRAKLPVGIVSLQLLIDSVSDDEHMREMVDMALQAMLPRLKAVRSACLTIGTEDQAVIDLLAQLHGLTRLSIDVSMCYTEDYDLYAACADRSALSLQTLTLPTEALAELTNVFPNVTTMACSTPEAETAILAHMPNITHVDHHGAHAMGPELMAKLRSITTPGTDLRHCTALRRLQLAGSSLESLVQIGHVLSVPHSLSELHATYLTAGKWSHEHAYDLARCGVHVMAAVMYRIFEHHNELELLHLPAIVAPDACLALLPVTLVRAALRITKYTPALLDEVLARCPAMRHLTLTVEASPASAEEVSEIVAHLKATMASGTRPTVVLSFVHVTREISRAVLFEDEHALMLAAPHEAEGLCAAWRSRYPQDEMVLGRRMRVNQ